MQSNEEVRSQVGAVLERFKDLVSRRNRQVLAEFAPEVALGKQELEAFFDRVFARDATFSWEWDRIDVSHAGNLAWFFADGRVVLSTAREQRKSPYRITGVLERHGERWLWRQYHGSEPVSSE